MTAYTIQQDFHFPKEGEELAIFTKTSYEPVDQYPSFAIVQSQFELQAGAERSFFGRCKGITIDRSIVLSKDRDELLQNLQAYDLPNDTGHGEQYHEWRPTFAYVVELLFGEEVEAQVDKKKLRSALDGQNPHYIFHFSLEKEFRGEGYTQHAMSCYVQSLEGLKHGHAFEGPIIIVPTPLPDLNAETPSLSRTAAKCSLTASFVDCGFKVYHIGDTNDEQSVAVMVRPPSLGPSVSKREAREEDADLDGLLEVIVRAEGTPGPENASTAADRSTHTHSQEPNQAPKQLAFRPSPRPSAPRELQPPLVSTLGSENRKSLRRGTVSKTQDGASLDPGKSSSPSKGEVYGTYTWTSRRDVYEINDHTEQKHVLAARQPPKWHGDRRPEWWKKDMEKRWD